MIHPYRVAPVLLVPLALACGFPPPADPSPQAVPGEIREFRARQQAESVALVHDALPTKQILFGDLHVHTTLSADAFMMALPFLQGDGAHPPADACDYARFCSGLDFWSINDHAESLSPRHWQQTKESVRQCNAVSGDSTNPDLVTFLGWEWTQVGDTAAEHYGHKNVIFRDIEDDRVPSRPISALTPQMRAALRTGIPLSLQASILLHDWANRGLYLDVLSFVRELQRTPHCAAGVDVRDLPDDCLESAETPAELFEKLRQWGLESIVIPHGTTWGLYTPPASSWDKQLAGAMHDPERQVLIEVYSGHGNSEEYRDWRPVEPDGEGGLRCPVPTKEYEPCCWRAGEIIRSRCAGASEDECERRVAAAQQHYVDAGILGHLTVPGAAVEDWRDCGQCRDCFLPAFNFRPAASAQYALALSNFEAGEDAPRRFRFGFIASSDNHSARPGTGYKEHARLALTEASGPCSEEWRTRVMLPAQPQEPEAKPFVLEPGMLQGQVWDTERASSFFLTGGLVAVHAEGRDRDSIWNALKRREVYGTSGDRILLWFDLLNGPDGVASMGSEVLLGEVPQFRIRAVGALEQLPGCPRDAVLPEERLERLCRGECFHPGDERRRIERIEVVRIRPQTRSGEPMAPLIDDPWRVFPCEREAAGCVIDFQDPDFVAAGRETIYYVRALQEPTNAVNAAGLRCRRNADGDCLDVDPCWGDYRTDRDDDCLAPVSERAWSSPIYVVLQPSVQPTRP